MKKINGTLSSIPILWLQKEHSLRQEISKRCNVYVTVYFTQTETLSPNTQKE